MWGVGGGGGGGGGWWGGRYHYVLSGLLPLIIFTIDPDFVCKTASSSKPQFAYQYCWEWCIKLSFKTARNKVQQTDARQKLPGVIDFQFLQNCDNERISDVR